MPSRNIPTIEPYVVTDDFVSGLACIDLVGSTCARFTWYVEQVPSDGGPPQRIVVRKLVMAIDDLPKAMRKLLRHSRRVGIAVPKVVELMA